jgi:hypothetical protein
MLAFESHGQDVMTMRLIREVAFAWLAITAIVVFGRTTWARGSSGACDWSDCVGNPEGCGLDVRGLDCVGECDQADDGFDGINRCEDSCDGATEMLSSTCVMRHLLDASEGGALNAAVGKTVVILEERLPRR